MKAKDPISSLTHFIGLLLSILALIILLVNSKNVASTRHIVSFTIFGVSLILLYLASSVYHYISIPKLRSTFHKIDHMMIFVLIAGTYTPICLIALRGAWGFSIFGIVWGVAIAGIVLKAFWIDAPRWLSTGIYIMMGWIVVIAFKPLVSALPSGGLIWLVAGGVVYTLGGLIYALKWPPLPFKHFGFHELFHLFVMAGSFCHFMVMYSYILPMAV
ncbi:hemolysin III [Natranaerovirga hydrolytica]|uniref:Hemolysin III n=1 Tax=Natranaerovirga hydrolytica TaxID=680378 RepID=A0A4R1MD63_9FIRM|nr:hemolysin III family protein [Natranaerovirga hydrolytica]TCK87969.1 hemolysin III [Natranaerovirga hydrolytica]